MPPADSPPRLLCCCKTRSPYTRGYALLAYAVESTAAPDDVTALREIAREFYTGDELARLEVLLDRRDAALRSDPRPKRRALELLGASS